MEVHSELGNGFLEAVYENSMAIELSEQQVEFERQVPFEVRYKNKLAGKYFADIVIEGKLLLELKAQRSLTANCEAQLLNYLGASGIEVGLLLNFGTKSLQIKRLVSNYNEATNI